MKSCCNLSRTGEAEITLSVQPNTENTPKSIYPVRVTWFPLGDVWWDSRREGNTVHSFGSIIWTWSEQLFTCRRRSRRDTELNALRRLDSDHEDTRLVLVNRRRAKRVWQHHKHWVCLKMKLLITHTPNTSFIYTPSHFGIITIF